MQLKRGCKNASQSAVQFAGSRRAAGIQANIKCIKLKNIQRQLTTPLRPPVVNWSLNKCTLCRRRTRTVRQTFQPVCMCPAIVQVIQVTQVDNSNYFVHSSRAGMVAFNATSQCWTHFPKLQKLATAGSRRTDRPVVSVTEKKTKIQKTFKRTTFARLQFARRPSKLWNALKVFGLQLANELPKSRLNKLQ